MLRQTIIIAFLITLLFIPVLSQAKNGQQVSNNQNCPELLNYELQTLDGQKTNLCQYFGKVIMVVNTASQDSFTRQLGELQGLYEKYSDKGLVILAFPTNEFGGKEPKTNPEIKEFNSRNYSISFPVFAKSKIKRKDGDNKFFMTLYRKIGIRPSWNYYKYFINRHGKPEKGFDTNTRPNDPRIIKMIEMLL